MRTSISYPPLLSHSLWHSVYILKNMLPHAYVCKRGISFTYSTIQPDTLMRGCIFHIILARSRVCILHTHFTVLSDTLTRVWILHTHFTSCQTRSRVYPSHTFHSPVRHAHACVYPSHTFHSPVRHAHACEYPSHTFHSPVRHAHACVYPSYTFHSPVRHAHACVYPSDTFHSPVRHAHACVYPSHTFHRPVRHAHACVYPSHTFLCPPRHVHVSSTASPMHVSDLRASVLLASSFSLNLQASNVRGKVNELRKGRQPAVEYATLCYRHNCHLHYLGASHIIIFPVYVITVVNIT
jgi:hypothetical protein